MKKTKEEYVYEPGNPVLITAMLDGKCIYTGKTKEDYLNENPGYIISEDWDYINGMLTEDENKDFIHPWTEIKEEKWTEMLEVLPPADWQGDNLFESFRLEEAMFQNIYAYFLRYGKQYYTANRRVGITHQELVEELKAQLNVKEVE